MIKARCPKCHSIYQPGTDHDCGTVPQKDSNHLDIEAITATVKVKFDKKAYQRELMRKRRKALKEKKT